ncbi:MAG: thioredoxin-dependent thiol peroxidase [Microthrixaceae bacterium]
MAESNVDDRLTIGKKAPAFTLKNQAGEKVRLSEFAGRKVLIFFYPKANTPGCTSQACGLRDIADEIGDTVILGISPDLPEKLENFDNKYSLEFPLLSDPDHAIAEKYGVWGEKKLYGKVYMGIIRSAFLVDEKGKLEQVWYKISPKDTPKKLLAALKAGAAA